MPKPSAHAPSTPRTSSRAKGTVRKPKAELPPAAEHEGMSRALWSGTLSFGLVTVPVELYSATRNQRGSLRMLAPDGTPLARRFFSESGKPLEADALERGYALDREHYVAISDDELERLMPDQSRDINLTRFVPQAAVPPLYFERAYILAPAREASSAYRLLASTMERLSKVGIATFVMRDRQYVVAISAREGILRAETLRFADELRTPENVGISLKQKPSESGLRHMRTAIKKLSKAHVSASELKDTYWQRVEKLAAHKKAQHKDVVPAQDAQEPANSVAEVVDLMELLKKSLAQGGAKAAGDHRPGVRKSKPQAKAQRREAG